MPKHSKAKLARYVAAVRGVIEKARQEMAEALKDVPEADRPTWYALSMYLQYDDPEACVRLAEAAETCDEAMEHVSNFNTWRRKGGHVTPEQVQRMRVVCAKWYEALSNS